MRRFFDLTATFYAWMTGQDAWRGSCAALVERLPPGIGLRIVDLGCGPGVSVFEVARGRPRNGVAGVDSGASMLQHARCRSRLEAPPANRIRWVCADAGQLPFRSGSVDALTGHSVLYLLSDRDAALTECLRVLRSGGRLVVMGPSDRRVRLPDLLKTSLDPRFPLSMALWRPMSRLRGRFGPQSLEAMLRRLGFATCRVEKKARRARPLRSRPESVPFEGSANVSAACSF
jgi:ubiquinone/menaquinone biosynthesis C-methylase UbiE